MKSYTDLKQSKKLAEILTIESADMWWNFYSVTTGNTTPQIIHLNTPWVGNFNWDNKSDNVPCWSLTALLGVIPYNVTFNKAVYRFKLVKFPDHWECYHENFGTVSTDIFKADNPIDACVEMIEKLYEQKLL